MNVEEAGDWLCVFSLIRLTKMREQDILATLTNAKIEPEQRIAPNRWIGPHFPAWVVGFLLEQTLAIPDNAGWYTIYGLSKKVRRSGRWVITNLKALKIRPIYRIGRNGHTSPHYPPSALRQLRQIANEIQPVRAGMYTQPKLASRVRKSQSWVIDRLERYDIGGEIRRDRRNHRVTVYSKSVLVLLQEEARTVRPAGKRMYNLTQLEEKIPSKGRKWIQSKLKEHCIAGEERLDSRNRPETFYGTETLRFLLTLAKAVPYADPGTYTLREMTALIPGKSRSWVEPRVKRMEEEDGIVRIIRLDRRNTEQTYYPKVVLERLLSEANAK